VSDDRLTPGQDAAIGNLDRLRFGRKFVKAQRTLESLDPIRQLMERSNQARLASLSVGNLCLQSAHPVQVSARLCARLKLPHPYRVVECTV